MHRHRHSLHQPVAITSAHRAEMTRVLAARRQKQGNLLAVNAEVAAQRPTPASYEFPITTFSKNYNFDAYIAVGFKGADPANAPHLMVDSGNTSLIVPRWEDIAAIPNYLATYTVLGQATEPWGCPANVVKGPIQLFEADGSVFTIEDCIFYACTGDSPSDHARTANFGTGCIVPWTASIPNVISSLGLTLQPILSQTAYPYVEFDYAPMDPVRLAGTTVTASTDSVIRIHAERPEGFQLFDIVRDCVWMSLIPKSLSIAGSPTEWPGTVASPIAMIDTAGGPVHLSDPNSYLCSSKWPQPVSNPAWASSWSDCQSIQAPLGITVGDETGSHDYVIDDATFPIPDQGLTLVMSGKNPYMMGRQGMNIGGISALVNAILIDFKNNKVGFRKT
jgi:hypothetical protein